MANGFPDWFTGTLAHGKYGELMKALACDDTGHLLALLKGEYAGGLKTLQTDSDGNLKFYFQAQAAPMVTTEETYGSLSYLCDTGPLIPQQTFDFDSTANTAVVAYCWIKLTGPNIHLGDYLKITSDKVNIAWTTINDIMYKQINVMNPYGFRVSYYSTAEQVMMIEIPRAVHCGKNFVVGYSSHQVTVPTVYYECYFTLG